MRNLKIANITISKLVQDLRSVKIYTCENFHLCNINTCEDLNITCFWATNMNVLSLNNIDLAGLGSKFTSFVSTASSTTGGRKLKKKKKKEIELAKV